MKTLLKISLLVLLIASLPAFSQNKSESLKRQAILLMNAGRYSEAIDQLNKYVAANPQEAEGYHKRALCYEKRTEYQYSILDLRRARNLNPTNFEIQKDLNRVLAIWNKQLYLKIEGHKRDILADPKNAFTYLEIGKSYRWLEEWQDAETWYDEYLQRDDQASPDEIIRYTEILAKTGSLIKGEKILKKYTERYPDDWRIWSRYGYFTLWLGKFNISEDAFKTSLGFKPFFKEAEDGLDLAKRQGYLTQYIPRTFERVEYPIDSFYRTLEKDPENDQIRFNLIHELISANRIEEVYQQLQFLRPKHAEEENFKSLWKNITEYRDSTFDKDVETYTGILKENPSDKEAVLKLAEAYSNLHSYGSAVEILREYLKDIPEDQDLDVRLMYAQCCAWNYELEKAIPQVQKLLQYDPNNLDYQLLAGQISVWTISDLDLGEKYLLNVIEVRPKELGALIGLVSFYSWQKKFPVAKRYLDLANSIAPYNSEVQNAQSNYELLLAAYQEQKTFEMKREASKLALEGKCDKALAKYNEYKSKRTALSRDEMVEYAQISTCTKNYLRAIEIYDNLLSEQYDYSIALQRAKNYYFIEDSTKALNELESLNKMKPDDYEVKLYLADTYAMINQLSKAEEIYRELKSKTENEKQIEQIDKRIIYLGEYYIKDKKFDKAEDIFDEMEKAVTDNNLKKELNLRRLYLGDAYVMSKNYGNANSTYNNILNVTPDTSIQRIVKERISWLPPTGINRGLSGIWNFFSLFLPTNIGLSPLSTFYNDNQNFQLWNNEMKLSAGFNEFLTLGAIWSRTNLNNSALSTDITKIKGLASIVFSNNFMITASYGILRFVNNPDKKIGGIYLKFNNDQLSIGLSYENTDAAMILQSQNLVNTRLDINHYHFNALYNYNNLMKFSCIYNYQNIRDDNEGNDVQIRIGKLFMANTFFGYEYYFSDYAFISNYYYSPQNFDSHSIWTEWNYQIKNWNLSAGIKVGYIPKGDHILGEIFGKAIYNIYRNLFLTGQLGYGNSFRYNESYKSFSSSLHLYWGIF